MEKAWSRSLGIGLLALLVESVTVEVVGWGIGVGVFRHIMAIILI